MIKKTFIKSISCFFVALILTGCANQPVYQPLREMNILSVVYQYQIITEQTISQDFQLVKLETKITNNARNPFTLNLDFFKIITNGSRIYNLFETQDANGQTIESLTIEGNSSQTVYFIVRIPTDDTVTLINFDNYRGELFEASVTTNNIKTATKEEPDPELDQQQEKEDN